MIKKHISIQFLDINGSSAGCLHAGKTKRLMPYTDFCFAYPKDCKIISNGAKEIKARNSKASLDTNP